MTFSERHRLLKRKCHNLLAVCLGIILLPPALPVLAQATVSSQPALPPWKIASAQPTGSSILGPAAALGTRTAHRKNKDIISDSLWGNLMLEIVFDRDPVLEKLGGWVRLMNLGTMTGIYAVSLGTLYQTIYATAVINPPPPHQDSTAPGIGGIAFSGVAVLTALSRAVIGHELSTRIHKRQVELRENLDTSLARLEESHCEDTLAAGQLKDLLGERAAGEWVQIYRSTHMTTEAHRVGMATPTAPKLMAMPTAPKLAAMPTSAKLATMPLSPMLTAMPTSAKLMATANNPQGGI